ncbi:lipid A deacylase LpxR family protein [bacterium AH-315-K03]|nr:lipid A deacylase LpxR family protein [bacterium AH-315-K03]
MKEKKLYQGTITYFIPLLVVFIVANLQAQTHEPGRWGTLTSENDIIAGDDGGYTNGISYTWGKGSFEKFEDHTPDWINWLSEDLWIATAANKRRGISYTIAQTMYTPTNIEIETPIANERPYAGILLWQTNLHAFDEKVSDRWSLALGVLGEASLAEQSQKFVHKVTGSEEPKGWDNQLNNEAVLRFQVSRLWRLINGDIGTIDYDVIGNTLASAGNLRSDLGLGVGFRLGVNLAQSFPMATTLPGRDINPLAAGKQNDWHVFINFYGRHVFNDITLDGDTDRDVIGVELEKNQSVAVFGVAFNWENWGFIVSTARGNKQFEEQVDDTEFGSMSVTYKY